MKPVHELTQDEAVLELERVSDLLMDASPSKERCDLLARQRELEAWILMHQAPKTPTTEPTPTEPPMAWPKGKKMTEESKQKIRDARAKCKGNGEKLDTSAGRVKEPALIGPHGEDPPMSPVVKVIGDTFTISSRPVQDAISAVRRQVWLLMADLEAVPMASREALAPDLALLDAAAHAAHQLALGRPEVA